MYAAAEPVYMNMLSETLKLNISVDSLRSGMDNKCHDYKSLNKENGQKGIGFSSFRMEGVLRKFRCMYRRGVFRIGLLYLHIQTRKRWREGLEISFAYKETNKKERKEKMVLESVALLLTGFLWS